MTRVLIIAFTFITLLSGCLIPSLHPIVDNSNRIIDDNIIGRYSEILERNIVNQYSIDIQTDTDENVDSLKDELATFLNELTEVDTSGTWTIERAANKTWKVNNEGSYQSVSFEGVPASFEPDNVEDYTLDEEELLDRYILIITHKEGWASRQQKTINDFTQSDMPPVKKMTTIVELTEIGGQKFMDFFSFPVLPEVVRPGISSSIQGHSFAKYEVTEKGILLFPFNDEFIYELIMDKKVRLKHEKRDIGEETQIVLTASTKELRSFISKYMDDDRLFQDPILYKPKQ